MTPYLVHKTWIDLDHVLAIQSEAAFQTGVEWVGIKPHATVNCEVMFRSKPLTIYLGEVTDNHLAGLEPAAHDQILADFIAAWKAKELNPPRAN